MRFAAGRSRSRPVAGGCHRAGRPDVVWDGGTDRDRIDPVRPAIPRRSNHAAKGLRPASQRSGRVPARELSYFVDYFDARLFEASMLRTARCSSLPVPSPHPLWRSSSRSWRCAALPPQAQLAAALMLLVFLSNYVHLVTMGMLYRSAKPLLVPVLMGAVYYVLAILRDRRVLQSPESVASDSGVHRFRPLQRHEPAGPAGFLLRPRRDDRARDPCRAVRRQARRYSPGALPPWSPRRFTTCC